MYRIDDPSASNTLPTPEAALTEGYWTEGNPGSGIPATLERASWFNMIQEELRNIVLAGGLTPSKTTYTQVRDAIKAYVGAGRLLNTQVFSASATYTPTPGTSQVRIVLIGGGGAGGGTPVTPSGAVAAGSGGGSGAYTEVLLNTGFSGGIAITVGAGGSPVTGSTGGNGGTTSFGANYTAPGGSGGGTASIFTPNFAAVAQGFGGVIGVVGTTVYSNRSSGQPGQSGLIISSNFISGQGAGGPYGGGGGNNAGGAGSAANGKGAGGGGAAAPASTAAQAGGAGSTGVIIIQEFA